MPRKSSILFLLLVFCATVAAAGTKEDIEQIQRNLIDLQQQFWTLQKDIQAGNRNLQDSVQKFQTMNESLRDSQAAVNAKLETVLNQLSALNSKLEETNRRLREMNTAPAGSLPGGTTPVTPGDTTTATTQQPAGQPGVVGEQQLMVTARAEYSKGNFEQALRGFQDFLDQYPNSPQADDAQFMIGESYYGMKEYVDAVTEYDKVIKGYPDSDRMPGARLKKAFSLQALAKRGQAVIELQQIIQHYPNSKEAQIARERLSELGLD